MSPAEKVNALKGGFMAERFTCDGGATDCSQAKLKQDLISKYQTEAEIQSVIATAGETLKNANGILQIANGLGIDTGDAGKVVNYANIALNTFASFASGNYIGAVAGLVGAFGSRGPDPQMAFLQAQFQQINQKLDIVIQNQQKLSQQISDLSDRLDKHVKQLNDRFDRVEAQIQRVRQLQAVSANADWQACQQLFVEASSNQGVKSYGFDRATSTFPSVDRAAAFANYFAVPLSTCTASISNRSGSIAIPNWFGQFLDVSHDVVISDNTLQIIDDDRANIWSLLNWYLTNKKIPTWRAMQMLSAPSPTLAVLEGREALNLAGGSACDAANPQLGGDRLRDLLCEFSPASSPNPSAAAAAVLSTSMLPDHAIDVSGWILVEQALVDVSAAQKQGFGPSSAGMMRYAASLADLSLGERHTIRAMALLDVVMANCAALHGDITTHAVLKGLLEPADDKSDDVVARNNAVREVLAIHPFLARNVALALLKSKEGIYVDGARGAGKPADYAYERSLTLAEASDQGDPNVLFATLFGPDVRFVRSPGRKVSLVLFDAQEDQPAVLAPMPEALAYKEGRLYYPNEVSAIAAQREHVSVRLEDFGATRSLSAAQLDAFIRTYVRSRVNERVQ